MSNLCRRSCCNCGWVAVSARCRCHLHVSQLSNSCTLPADLLLLLRLYHGNFHLFGCCGLVSASLLWSFGNLISSPISDVMFLQPFSPCSCGGKRPWRWRLVLISLFLIWKRRCQGRGYLQLCSAESTLDRPLSTYLLFSWFSRQIRFKYGSALSGFSLKELITAWCLITVQSIVYSY